MRRTLFGSLQPSRAVCRAIGNWQQPRRSFAAAGYFVPAGEQAFPVGPFYEAVLRTTQGAVPQAKPEEPPVTSPQSPKAAPEETKEAAAASEPAAQEEKAKPAVTFSSSLAGPAERAERLARIRNESRLVAGVLVPPRPEEPDNCCMSGCVNCVWDRYRDEMEDWAARSAEAERRLAAREAGAQVGVTEESMDAVVVGRGEGGGGGGGGGGWRDEAYEREGLDRGAMGMDDDGGGSWGSWTGGGEVSGSLGKDFFDEDLYKNVPVGIREFMKQEKRLKEKRLREEARGG